MSIALALKRTSRVTRAELKAFLRRSDHSQISYAGFGLWCGLYMGEHGVSISHVTLPVIATIALYSVAMRWARADIAAQ
jgi:hypothetical protein